MQGKRAEELLPVVVEDEEAESEYGVVDIEEGK